jgi:transposase
MYKDMDLYAKVRRAVMMDAMSERAAARNFGISRKTVNKMVNHTAPPGYQRKDRPVAPWYRPSVWRTMAPAWPMVSL